MKKLVSMLLALTMAIVLFAGCAGTGNTPAGTDSGNQQTTAPAETESAPAAVTESAPAATDGTVSTGYPIADSFTAFVTAKGDMLTNLINALGNNQDTAMETMALAGVATVDMALVPVSAFGMGEEAAKIGLGYLNAADVQYSENGNSYTVSYKSGEGKALSLTGVWDAASGSLVCTGSTDGAEDFYSEYHKTSYGYIGQYYVVNNDGTSTLYVVTVQGKDGVLGISAASGKPAALTGSEPLDYPSSCDMWYAINGTTVTGKASDGTEINFEYVPAQS